MPQSANAIMPSLDDSGTPAATAQTQISNVLDEMETGNADYDAMEQALRDAQKAISSLRSENVKLKSDLSNMILAKAAKASGRHTPAPSSTGASRAATPRSATPSVNVSGTADESEGSLGSGEQVRKRIRQLGSHFHLFYMFYIAPAAFSFHKAPFPHDDISRIGRKPDEILAAELYDCLPVALHQFVTTVQSFREEFTQAVGQARSNTIGRIRSFVAKLWRIENADIFILKNNISRSSDARICKLLGQFIDPRSNSVAYAPLPPFIYKDEDTSRPEGLFLNEKFIETIAKIIIGPSASQARSNNTVLRTDRPNETTIGLICTTYTYLLFIFSDDNAFTAVGKGSVFDYKQRCEFAKTKIIEGKRDLPVWYDTLMKTLNTKFFNQAAPAAAAAEQEIIDIGEQEQLHELFMQLQIEERALAEAGRGGIQQDNNLDHDNNADNDDIYVPEDEIDKPLDIPPQSQQQQPLPPRNTPLEPQLNVQATGSQGHQLVQVEHHPEHSAGTGNSRGSEMESDTTSSIPPSGSKPTRGSRARGRTAAATPREVTRPQRLTRSNAAKGPQ